MIVKPLLQFSRPHTMLGTLVSVPCISHSSGAGVMPLGLFSSAILPSLLMNAFIVGINQIHDIPIDKISKPHLPLAAGTLSLLSGSVFCVTCLFLSLLITFLHPLSSSPLKWTICLSALVGYLYSCPPFRLKRNPFSAALCIVFVRGFLANWGFYEHSKTLSAIGNRVAKPLLLPLCIHFSFFALSIALEKDRPDMVADGENGIQTFSQILGKEEVLFLSRTLLLTSQMVSSFLLLKSPALIFASLVMHLSPSYKSLWRGFYASYLSLLL